MARSFVSRARPKRRARSWGIGPGNLVVTQLSTSVAVLVGDAISPTSDGITIARIRGELTMWLSQATNANNGFIGAFGIGKATAAVFTAGAPSVPSPITEEGWDGWLYHRYFNLKSNSIIGTGAASQDSIANSTTAAMRVDIDVRAMRKLVVEDVIYAAVEVTELGSAIMQLGFNSRALALLP